MRRIIAMALAGAVVAAVFAAPVSAGGKKSKHVHGSMSASLLPFPKDERWHVNGPMPPGCTAGQEGVNWIAQEFTAPGKGTLRFYMEGFVGDHDIYVFAPGDMITPLMRGDTVQVGSTSPAPQEEEINFPLKKGQKIVLAACNWLGHPDVVAHYEGHFK